ncbi:MAG TPA: GyrI-like domain-containing protein [Gemmatimonadaceae bacterium]|nr:GyrI-like domain-containing protein [Gemmatimonadaceae bacterium]
MTKSTLEHWFSNRRKLLLAGVSAHYAEQSSEAFAEQWEKFAPMIGKMPGQVGTEAYGVVTGSFGGHDGFEYITGVEVSDLAKVPAKFRRLTIPAQRYAVFVHNGHVSKINETMYTIKKEWLPKWMVPGRTDASQEGGDQPDFFERYGKDFDPKTGTGKVELWVPLKR